MRVSIRDGRIVAASLALAGLTACTNPGSQPQAQSASAASVVAPVAVAVATQAAVASAESTAAPVWNPRPVRVYAGPDVVQPVDTKTNEAALIVAEGEFFRPLDKKGWQVVHQDDSYGSHSYGGMWTMNGGLLGAPCDSEGSVASRKINVTQAGE